MTKKILLINDLPGYGKVAVSAMSPVLIRHGYELFILPTMIVSNTLNYGKFAIIDTTEYMKEAVQTWKELGFKFDAISTGFIANDEQAEFILNFCREQSEVGVKIFTDPIMADNGKLYNSVPERRVEAMKKIITVSDYIFPNQTEACFLSGVSYNEVGYSRDELYKMATVLHQTGAKSVVITSAMLKNVNHGDIKAVVGYDGKKDNLFSVEYDEIPVKINGSGDLFSAIIIAEIMDGAELEPSVRKAVTGVRDIILRNIDTAKEYNGLPVEADIEIL